MRARRLGSRRASHLIDVERKRSCTGSVHSSGSFCTKLENLALRTPPSWLAAGAPGRMPAVRRPAMHHSSLCAGAYLKGHRETRIGGGSGVWGTLESPGEKWGEKRLPFFPPRALAQRRAAAHGRGRGGRSATERGEQGADALTGINAYGYAGVGIKVSIRGLIKRGVGPVSRAAARARGRRGDRRPRVRYH
jgi:hypothetical protein